MPRIRLDMREMEEEMIGLHMAGDEVEVRCNLTGLQKMGPVIHL